MAQRRDDDDDDGSQRRGGGVKQSSLDEAIRRIKEATEKMRALRDSMNKEARQLREAAVRVENVTRQLREKRHGNDDGANEGKGRGVVAFSPHERMEGWLLLFLLKGRGC